MNDTDGVYYAREPLPEGSALVGGRLYNIQDGKEYPACMTPVAIGIGVMFVLALLVILA